MLATVVRSTRGMYQIGDEHILMLVSSVYLSTKKINYKIFLFEKSRMVLQ
jgi:hypothetical protein